MRASRPIRNTHERGFGLLELIVTVVIVSVVLGVIMQTLFKTSNQAEHLTDVADMRQSARTAVQLMEREIRMAGSGWGRMTVYGNNSAGVTDSLHAVNIGFNGVASSDSFKLVGAWQASTTITNSMPNSSAILSVTDVTGFADGDLIIITDGSSAHMMQVTGVNSAAQTIQHNPAVPYNSPGGHANWPAGGYAIGSRLYKITISSYYYDTGTYRRPVLFRHEYGQSPQVVAYDVDGFRVWYELQDGTLTRNPPDLSAVDKVIPVVLTRVTDPRRPTLTDSVWTSVQPRTF